MIAETIGLIGAGRMATALASGLVRAKLLAPEAIVASDPNADARASFARAVPGAAVGEQNGPVVATSDVVILAVKPQQMAAVLSEIRRGVRPQTLMVSIAAGLTLKRLEAGLPPGQRVVRVMPNTPCLIGAGASAFSLGGSATANDGKLVAVLFSAVGSAAEVPESMLDAVTGLSGSGPAFVYSMIGALARGGAEAGLSADLAGELAARTVAGAAQMVLQTGEAPAVLRERVTSPGGTTLAGLAVLQERGFEAAVTEAVAAAARRSAELGQSIE
jgi:pyrroline-5-carboxylate reductase